MSLKPQLIALLSSFAFVGLAPQLAHAQQSPAVQVHSIVADGQPTASYPLPKAPEIQARAYLLIDVTAGSQILASKNPEQSVEPASLTKLMTAYIVFDALKNKRISLQQKFTVSERARKMEGSRMFVEAGWEVPVEDLLKGLIVQSGNDAATVLAEGVGGSVDYFVQLMNHKAKQLGMKNTSYKNPEGLTADGHTTTAYDLAILAQRLMQDFPEYTGYYAIKSYRYPGTPISNDTNRNTLLFRDPTVDGLKTGHTNAAGYCLVATAKREYRSVGARRLISVVLGTNSETIRANESQKLLNWGYSAFQPVKLFEGGKAVTEVEIWKGKQNTLKLGLPRDVVIAIPVGTAGQITTNISRPETLFAPVKAQQAVATLQINIAGQAYRRMPLQALENVEQAGFVGRSWDSLRLWIR